MNTFARRPIATNAWRRQRLAALCLCLLPLAAAQAAAPTIRLFPTAVLEEIKHTGNVAQEMEAGLQPIIHRLDEQQRLYQESKCDGAEGDPGCQSDADASEQADCGDGLDNDGDGLVDAGSDPGCASTGDASETSAAYACDDGVDNDGDTLVDVAEDPSCVSPFQNTEVRACQDGADNDGDGRVDFDGGVSALGAANPGVTVPDPQCGSPSRARESASSCGMGIELVMLLPFWAWLRRRKTKREA